jgi:hypothetical protein
MRRVQYTALIFVLFGAAAVQAQTQVPNVFQSGQPARASEVNDNFAAVAAAIDESASTTLSEIDAATKRWEQGCIDFDDSFWETHLVDVGNNLRQPGTEIVIDGETFTWAKVPFVEHATGERYFIYIPTRNSNFKLYTRHDPDPLPCSDHWFILLPDIPSWGSDNALPARIQTVEMREIGVMNGVAKSIMYVTATVMIRVNETIVTIEMPTVPVVETEGAVSAPCCDLTTVLNFESMIHPNIRDGYINQLSGYIHIEPAQ